MLGLQRLHARRVRAAWKIVKRRVPFPERDGLVTVGKTREQLAEAPDAACVRRSKGRFAFLPNLLQGISIVTCGPKASGRFPSGIENFEEVTTVSTAKVLLGTVGGGPAVDAA
jgi:hypothetical protein